MAHEYFRQHGSFDKALSHLIEESGEVLSAAGKTLRFGPESCNPLIPASEQEANIDWLRREIADLKLAIQKFEEECQPPMSVYVILRQINEGEDTFRGGTTECSSIEKLAVANGFATCVAAERSPRGRRTYQLTTRGKELIGAE